MATFTENMKALTDELAACAHVRADTLETLRTQTEQLLSNAESFLQRLDQEHEAMASQVRSTLSQDRQELAQRVAETREQIGQRFREVQKRFHETLQACQETRHEHLDRLLQGFEETRQALAKDLQEAGRIWRGHHDGKAARRKAAKTRKAEET